MAKKVVILGVGSFARELRAYIERDEAYTVVAFCVDKEFVTESEDLPIISLEDLPRLYPSDEHEVLIAIGYSKLNTLRQKKFKQIQEMGYTIASYVSKKANINTNLLGVGNIILDNVRIGFFTKIGDGNIIGDGANIAHDNNIGNFNFLAMSSSIAGNVTIEDYCFIGNNATVRDGVCIKDFTLIGAATYIDEDTQEYQLCIPQKAIRIQKGSKAYLERKKI
ncbi:MAG: acetyltransferase [Cellulosilyticum sp.]|nr:acetyltransferase [Cellulosilyticum sp.]